MSKGIHQETVDINLTREFVLYMSRIKKIRKHIDELYYKNYEKCSEIENEVKDKLIECGINVKQETIENVCYINKIIALMILDEKSSCRENTERIVSVAFNKAYKYAKSNNVIKLSHYLSRKIDVKNSSPDEIIAENLCLIVTGELYDKKIDEDDEFFKALLASFYGIKNVEDGALKYTFAYENCSKYRKKIINELELIIRSRYFEKGYKYDSFHEALLKKDCFNPYDCTQLIIPKVKDDFFAKMLLTVEYTDDLLNKTNATSLLEYIDVKQDTIKAFINTYLELSGYSLELDSKIDKDDIDFDELTTFVFMCLIQTLYLEAYGNTYEFFFNNYSEQTKIKHKETLDENRHLKDIHIKLQKENEELKLEHEELQRKIEKLEKQLKDEQSNKMELSELRSYIFNNQEDESDFKEDSIDLEHLKDKNIVCFGGNKAWISNMSKEFSTWTFIPADAVNFDVAVLKNADIAFIKATYISHGMYYKVIANLGENTEIKFINNSNTDRIKQEISLKK